MADITQIATSMLGIGIALSMLLMGLLISYYGSSKTRNVGLLFLIIGAVIAFIVTFKEFDDVVFMNSILAFIGGMLGGIIGIVIFLVAIIKS